MNVSPRGRNISFIPQCLPRNVSKAGNCISALRSLNWSETNNSGFCFVFFSFRPGSIKTRAELLFLDTGVVKDSNAVQNVISSAERASQWEQSDAREMGQFVVCSDCVTVDLDYTRVRQLPPPLVLDGGGKWTFRV